MAEPFKLLINAGTVAQAGHHLQRAWPGFDRKRFETLATTGLQALELKARVMHLADALVATLPADFTRTAGLIEASLAPPLPLDDRGEPVALPAEAHEQGLSGWAVWVLGDVVVRQGMDDVPRALRCLHALTQRFSAEFAIRPFIAQHPQPTLDTLAQWVHDPSAHVRRLVSEGSRPRLPWGLRLQALVRDPSPTLGLLRALQDDPSAYVRRSVANHLNDIAKDHPALVAQWLQQHLPEASAARTALLRHASRTLIKQGHAPTLAAWGLGAPLLGQASLALSTAQASIGDTLALQVTLRSTSDAPQTLMVDYAVHHQRANGRTTPKVFKGWKLTLAPQALRVLDKRHSLRPVTTRQLYPGPHRIELRINGQTLADASFTLQA
jgi:3-methyladenine DNA glycosylase AlkC